MQLFYNINSVIYIIIFQYNTIDFSTVNRTRIERYDSICSVRRKVFSVSELFAFALVVGMSERCMPMTAHDGLIRFYNALVCCKHSIVPTGEIPPCTVRISPIRFVLEHIRIAPKPFCYRWYPSMHKNVVLGFVVVFHRREYFLIEPRLFHLGCGLLWCGSHLIKCASRQVDYGVNRSVCIVMRVRPHRLALAPPRCGALLPSTCSRKHSTTQ